MAEETLILNIEIDQGEALKSLQESESALVDLKNEQKELNDQLKAGTITQNEYAASKVQLDQKIQSETANRRTLTQAIQTESNSLNAQKQKLAELIKERNNIDRSTVEGAKKFDQMNGSILTLNNSIKAAEAQGGSFQRNVGNYKGVIDNFTGGAYSAAQGVGAMTKASIAFIATPIGAIIAAIGLALGSLMAYFRGSEEGQNRLNRIMAIGGQIMERITDIAEDIGEAVFEAFSNPKQAMIDLFNFLKDNIINRFTAFATILEGITSLDFKMVANGVIQAGTGVENVIDRVQEFGKEASTLIDKAVKDGTRLADLNAKRDKEERKALEETSARKLQISELRRQADESEGQNKLDFLNQALELERLNAEQELSNAQLKRDIAAEEVTLNGATKEALLAQAQAEADLNTAKAAYFENTRKMNRERIATENEIAATLEKRFLEDIKLEQQEAIRAHKAQELSDAELLNSLENIEKKTAEHEKSLMINMEGIQEEVDAEIAASNADYENYKANEEKKRDEAEKTRMAVIASVVATGDVTADIFEKVTAIKNHEAAIQIQDVKLQQQEELKALQAKLDAGEISEEEFKTEKLRIEREAAKAEDDIKMKAFDANKRNRIADSIIDAIQSGIAAFRALAGIPIVGPALGAVAAAAAVAFGYRQVDLIRQEKYVPGGFAEGGYTGPGDKYQVAGVVHRDEYVVPAWQVHNPMYAGHISALEAGRMRGFNDGGLVKNTAMAEMSNLNGLAEAISQIKIYAAITEINAANAALSAKINVVER